MKQNAYNAHAFTSTEKAIQRAVADLTEELKSYKAWFKTVDECFDAYQPHFYYNSFRKIAEQLIKELVLINNFVGEVFNARLKDLP